MEFESRWLSAMALSPVLIGVSARPCPAQCSDTLPNNSLAVDRLSEAVTPDGRSWECAFTTIQQALAVAEASEGEFTQIWVKADTYTLDTTTDTFLLVDGVWLLGGFNGTETLRTQADPYANPTILDGDNTAYHVVTATDTTNSTVFTRLDGFIIRNGNAVGDTTHPRGGGLIMRSSNSNPVTDSFYLKVSRCRFIDNDSSRGGAVAVYRPLDNSANARHHLELTNCEFTGNTAFNGGAVWNFGAIIQINNSLFVNNTASNHGGALALAQSCTGNPTECGIRNCGLLQQSIAYVNSCTITENHAGNEAGGIHVRYFGPELLVTGSILWGNTDESSATDTVEKEQIVREFFCSGELGTDTAVYSCIEGLDLYAGLGNIGDNSTLHNPDFISSTDFRLQASSPCIDTGDVGTDFPFDLLDFDRSPPANSRSILPSTPGASSPPPSTWARTSSPFFPNPASATASKTNRFSPPRRTC